MTCPQNCDFVWMEAGSKVESAWCGIMAAVLGQSSRGRVGRVDNDNLANEAIRSAHTQINYVTNYGSHRPSNGRTNASSSKQPSSPKPTIGLINLDGHV